MEFVEGKESLEIRTDILSNQNGSNAPEAFLLMLLYAEFLIAFDNHVEGKINQNGDASISTTSPHEPLEYSIPQPNGPEFDRSRPVFSSLHLPDHEKMVVDNVGFRGN